MYDFLLYLPNIFLFFYTEKKIYTIVFDILIKRKNKRIKLSK